MLHPFYSDGRVKWEPAHRPGGRSETGPRLSLGNDATFGPKAPYFTVDLLVASPRLRAGAAEIRGSSRGLANPLAGVADLT